MPLAYKKGKEEQAMEEEEDVDDLIEQLKSEPDKLTRPIKSIKDKYELLPHFLKMRGLVRQHIDSFNYLVNEEIKVRSAMKNAGHGCYRNNRHGFPGHDFHAS